MNQELMTKSLELARKMAAIGNRDQACQLYKAGLGLQESRDSSTVEAASYLLEYDDDYRIGYSVLIEAFQDQVAKDHTFDLLAQVFYYPNLDIYAGNYAKNVEALTQYPYLFDRDFPDFDQLTTRYFFYDHGQFLPYDGVADDFLPLVEPRKPLIDRWFFQDTGQPLLVEDIYNGYHLEYLQDMVRKSEWCGRDNHIYLYYQSFDQFAAFLQVVDLAPLLAEEKFVFLFEDQRSLYPLDFKGRFNLDYSTMATRPIGVREVKKVIWHIQTLSHTGGDFFNEILDFHPNILSLASAMHDELEKGYRFFKENYYRRGFFWDKGDLKGEFTLGGLDQKYNLFPGIMRRLRGIKNADKKDWFVALSLTVAEMIDQPLDLAIVPAILYQPHFHNNTTTIEDGEESCKITNETYEAIKKDPLINQFKYIKSLATVRRFTTSLGGTYRFAFNSAMKEIQEAGNIATILHFLKDLLANRNLYTDPSHPLFADIRAIRFEDGKLNPRATLLALCEFLDTPWHDSLLTTTVMGEHREYNVQGSVSKGFDLHPVYNRYEDYLSPEDMYIIELVLENRLAQYGYKPLVYDGKAHSLEDICALMSKPMKAWDKQREIVYAYVAARPEVYLKDPKIKIDEVVETLMLPILFRHQNQMNEIIDVCFTDKPLVSPEGNYLYPIPWLEPKADLLERPLYE